MTLESCISLNDVNRNVLTDQTDNSTFQSILHISNPAESVFLLANVALRLLAAEKIKQCEGTVDRTFLHFNTNNCSVCLNKTRERNRNAMGKKERKKKSGCSVSFLTSYLSATETSQHRGEVVSDSCYLTANQQESRVTATAHQSSSMTVMTTTPFE